MKTFAAVVCSIVFLAGASAQQASSSKRATEAACPMHDGHSEMNERGEKGMGFSQSATTHHFFLKADGGVIQVEANDSADTARRDEIRMHLVSERGLRDSDFCARYNAAGRTGDEATAERYPLHLRGKRKRRPRDHLERQQGRRDRKSVV